MPDTQQKISPRSFEENAIVKFKGVNFSDGSYNMYGGDEAEAAVLTNFNTTPEGYLQKRRGFALFANFTGVGNAPAYMRFCGALRQVNARQVWLYWTDGSSLWRCRSDGLNMAEVKMETSNNVLGGMSWIVQNGNPPSNYYNGTGLSNVNGIIGVYTAFPTTTNGWVPSSAKGTYAVTFKNRMWVIYPDLMDANENRLQFSGVGAFTDWTGGGSAGGGNIYIEYADGDYISAIVPYNDNLLIFKSRKTYSFTADGDPSNWSYRLISDRVGALSWRSIAPINGYLYFLSADGVYKSDGTTFQIISEPVTEILNQYRRSLNPLLFHNVFAQYYDNKYILFIPRDEPTANNQAIVYDLLTEQWSYWDFPNMDFLSGYRLADTATDKLIMGCHVPTKNKLWIMDSAYQDNGVNYTATWQSRKQDFGNMMYKKRNHLVSAVVSHDPNAPVGGYGPEVTVTSKILPTNEQYDGGSVSGQKFHFSPSCHVLGVEFITPQAAGSGNYEVAIWSDTGTTLHRMYYGPLSESGAGWHKVYFDTPFVPAVTTPIPTMYMVSVGYPLSGTNNRGYSHVTQTTINQAPILNGSNNHLWQKQSGPRGYPELDYAGQDANFSQLGPIVAIPDPNGVTIEVTADDTSTVTTTMPVAKISERLIKARGAGYGRYFQTKFTHLGSGPFSLYGLAWMNETRGIQPNSGPYRNT